MNSRRNFLKTLSFVPFLGFIKIPEVKIPVQVRPTHHRFDIITNGNKYDHYFLEKQWICSIFYHNNQLGYYSPITKEKLNIHSTRVTYMPCDKHLLEIFYGERRNRIIYPINDIKTCYTYD